MDNSSLNAGLLLPGSWNCHFLALWLGTTGSTSLNLHLHLKNGLTGNWHLALWPTHGRLFLSGSCDSHHYWAGHKPLSLPNCLSIYTNCAWCFISHIPSTIHLQPHWVILTMKNCLLAVCLLSAVLTASTDFQEGLLSPCEPSSLTSCLLLCNSGKSTEPHTQDLHTGTLESQATWIIPFHGGLWRPPASKIPPPGIHKLSSASINLNLINARPTPATWGALGQISKDQSTFHISLLLFNVHDWSRIERNVLQSSEHTGVRPQGGYNPPQQWASPPLLGQWISVFIRHLESPGNF